MLRRQPYGQEIDWWALGIMLYYMLTGQRPFTAHNNLLLENKIMHAEVKYPENISKEAASIIRMVSVINIKTEAFKVP
jgi:serine/threonine protein kinase